MHTFSIKKNCTLTVVFTIVLALFFAFTFATTADAKFSASNAKNSGTTIEEGIYRIVSVSSGQSVDSYDVKYDRNGSSYLNKRSTSNAQEIFVKKLSDGTYQFYPQSEGGVYALSYTSGSTITKTKNMGSTEGFDIFPLSNGYYTIAPSNGSDSSNNVLEVSSQKSRYNHNYVSLGEYSKSESQMWIFEKLDPTSISISQSNVRVKLFTVDKLNLIITPSYVTVSPKWTSSDESVVLVDSDGSYTAIGIGKAYVTATYKNFSVTCLIEVSNNAAFTFYSQHNLSGSNWDGISVSNVVFSAGGFRKKFALDKYNSNLDWMDEGCVITSIAMVLNNMGAKLTEGYDLRNGQTNNLKADPYTVALANSGNHGAKTANAVLSGNPIYTNMSIIASRFNVDGEKVVAERVSNVSKKSIKEALDKNPQGVVVGFYKASTNESHYMVFTKCVNPDEKNPNNYKFIVNDPAAYDAADGENVLFEDSYSYKKLNYRFSNLIALHVWSTSAN